MNPAHCHDGIASSSSLPRPSPPSRGSTLLPPPRCHLDSSNVLGCTSTSRVVSPVACNVEDEQGEGGSVGIVGNEERFSSQDQGAACPDVLDQRVVTTRTTPMMKDAAIEPAVGGRRSANCQPEPRVNVDPDHVTSSRSSRVLLGGITLPHEKRDGRRSGPFRGTYLHRDKRPSPRPRPPSCPSESPPRPSIRRLLLRWDHDDNSEGVVGGNKGRAVGTPSSPRGHLSPSSLCRQHTDVSALTWDGDSAVTTALDNLDLRGSGPVPHPARGVMAPTRPNNDVSNRRQPLGRRCVADLIEEDEPSVGADGGIAATQPPKMPVRKVSNQMGPRHRATTDSHPSSSLPPALPLRQATMTTVITADSTAVVSAPTGEPSSVGCSAPHHGPSRGGGALDMGSTRIGLTADTATESNDLQDDNHIDGDRSRRVRRGKPDVLMVRTDRPVATTTTTTTTTTEEHPPVMPVRKASLLSTTGTSPDSDQERRRDAAEARMGRTSDDPEPGGVVVQLKCSARRLFEALPTTERPPHLPSRMASG